MEKTIEVELKFEVGDDTLIKTFLASLTKQSQSDEEDIYYDSKDGFLFQRGIFIRIRNNSRLDFNFNEEMINANVQKDHMHCSEHTFPIPLEMKDLQSLNETLSFLSLDNLKDISWPMLQAQNNWKPLAVIKKNRTVYTDGTFLYMYDEIEKIGTFLEVEAHTTDSGKVPLIEQAIQNALTYLPLAYINTGYCELYLRKTRPELYKKGKYLLESDKNDMYLDQ